MLKVAIERNRRLREETRVAALGMLNVCRAVFLGSADPSAPLFPASVLEDHFDGFRLLDLPSELLQVVLSFVYPGALSARQFLLVAKLAADRGNLLENPPAGKRQFLVDTDCDCYDR